MTVKLAIAVLAGGFAAQHSRVLISWDQCLPILVALVVASFLPRLRLVAAFVAGFIVLHLASSLVIDDRLDTRYSGDSMLATVRVVDFPAVDGRTTTMIVAPVRDSRLPPRSRVTWLDAPVKPALGDTWQLVLRLRRPRGAANPGGFDLEHWMFRERIHGSGYVVPGKRNRLLQSGDVGPVGRLRAGFQRSARVAPDEQGVLSAIAVGVRHGISRDQWEDYARTGTSHLMAISGLHVGLAAVSAFALVYALSALLGSTGNHLRYATLGGVLVAAAYSSVSGLGIPAQRATLMLALAAVALLAQRRIHPTQVLALCAIAVFATNPISTMSPGFGLSFGAVAVLYRAAVICPQSRGWAGKIGRLWSAQWFLFFGLLPLSVTYFDRVALLAPPVNLIVVPLFSLIAVPTALVALVGVAVDAAIAEPAIRIAAAGVRSAEFIIAKAIDWVPVASTARPQVGAVAVLPWLALTWVVLPRGWPGRSLALLAVAGLFMTESRGPPTGCVDVHVLDVGQGQSIIVRTAQRTLVYDAGPAYRSGRSAAQHVVIPVLEHLGVHDIDWLVVSHADLDHAGGVRDLSNAVRIGRTFVSEPVGVPGINAFRCRVGQHWRADDIDFRILHPELGPHSGGNNGSCVLEVAAGRKRVLLTGDIEAEAEQRLLQRELLRSSMIVTVPHHGSETSSSPSFIARLQPEIAIASTGFSNRWNFPSERIRRRWEGAGARFFDTGTMGAVSARLCRWRAPRTVTVERARRQRFWHEDAESW